MKNHNIPPEVFGMMLLIGGTSLFLDWYAEEIRPHISFFFSYAPHMVVGLAIAVFFPIGLFWEQNLQETEANSITKKFFNYLRTLWSYAKFLILGIISGYIGLVTTLILFSLRSTEMQNHYMASFSMLQFDLVLLAEVVIFAIFIYGAIIRKWFSGAATTLSVASSIILGILLHTLISTFSAVFATADKDFRGFFFLCVVLIFSALSALVLFIGFAIAFVLIPFLLGKLIRKTEAT